MSVKRPAPMQLNFKVHAGHGPHLLLIHGFLMSATQWLPNLEALSRVCRPVVAELWGHGASPSPDDPDAYLPNSYVEAFEAIRASLGVERWWVCGYSLGAGLTINYALAHPARIEGHIFTNSTSGFADAAQIDAWRRGAAAAAANIEAAGLDAIERMPVHPRHAKRLPAALYDALRRDSRQLNPRGIANTLRYTNPNVSVRTRVAANTRPALLVCGRHESRFAAHRDYAAAHMPHLTVVDIDAGHGVNMEAPDAFNHAVAAFVTQDRPATA
jgi:2-succinyl-6-hydroxy-2,4-cyclohexadiene-1-carboxylate synthase